MPFREFLKLSKIVAGRMDFSPGKETTLLRVPNAPKAIPTICYEGIFQLNNPELVANSEVGWLLNLTNDAWFGASSGPYQHLEATRFRALEYGLPMVRVANTGLSAVIDPYGRTIVSSRLNEKTALDSSLPNISLFPMSGHLDLLNLVWRVLPQMKWQKGIHSHNRLIKRESKMEDAPSLLS